MPLSVGITGATGYIGRRLTRALIARGGREEVQFTAAQEMLRQRERYLVAVIDGERHDAGDPKGLVETQLALALRSPYADAVRQQMTARRRDSG